MEKVNFELPESAVAQETRNAVYDIVHQNTKRGVSRELIEQQKDDIYAAATSSAKERVKLAFLIQRIAEKEGVKVTQEEVLKRAQAHRDNAPDSARPVHQGFAEAQRAWANCSSRLRTRRRSTSSKRARRSRTWRRRAPRREAENRVDRQFTFWLPLAHGPRLVKKNETQQPAA